MNENEATEHGQRLLNAVERFVAEPDVIIGVVKELEQVMLAGRDVDPMVRRRAISERVIKRYSDACAISGGATALPGLLPGLGTLATLAGGTLADMALLLKFEVEMSLALSHLFGFDIRDEKERKIAFLLASVSTYDIEGKRNFFSDALEAEATAFWNYAPRQLYKLLVTVMARLVLLTARRGLVRSIPLVGVVVGASMNKVLTTRVGERLRDEYDRRRRLDPEVAPDGDVVDARVK